MLALVDDQFLFFFVVVFRVKTVSENHREGPVEKDLSINETETPSATFSLSTSVQSILVWVQAKNDLGSVKSFVVNFTISDIRKWLCLSNVCTDF